MWARASLRAAIFPFLQRRDEGGSYFICQIYQIIFLRHGLSVFSGDLTLFLLIWQIFAADNKYTQEFGRLSSFFWTTVQVDRYEEV
jgi:hypothetical protein